jgi:hypothetical protein
MSEAIDELRAEVAALRKIVLQLQSPKNINEADYRKAIQASARGDNSLLDKYLKNGGLPPRRN